MMPDRCSPRDRARDSACCHSASGMRTARRGVPSDIGGLYVAVTVRIAIVVWLAKRRVGWAVAVDVAELMADAVAVLFHGAPMLKSLLASRAFRSAWANASMLIHPGQVQSFPCEPSPPQSAQVVRSGVTASSGITWWAQSRCASPSRSTCTTNTQQPLRLLPPRPGSLGILSAGHDNKRGQREIFGTRKHSIAGPDPSALALVVFDPLELLPMRINHNGTDGERVQI